MLGCNSENASCMSCSCTLFALHVKSKWLRELPKAFNYDYVLARHKHTNTQKRNGKVLCLSEVHEVIRASERTLLPIINSKLAFETYIDYFCKATDTRLKVHPATCQYRVDKI